MRVPWGFGGGCLGDTGWLGGVNLGLGVGDAASGVPPLTLSLPRTKWLSRRIFLRFLEEAADSGRGGRGLGGPPRWGRFSLHPGEAAGSSETPAWVCGVGGAHSNVSPAVSGRTGGTAVSIGRPEPRWISVLGAPPELSPSHLAGSAHPLGQPAPLVPCTVRNRPVGWTGPGPSVCRPGRRPGAVTAQSTVRELPF